MMAFDSRNLDDYVDVATRLAEFRELYPSGSIQPADPTHPWEQAVVTGYDKSGKEFTATMIVYVAAAYRTPDDTRPGIGCAWEPFPGRTPYTAGSELMNAETSAWGRAILAVLASDSRRGVASREEVRNRAAERDPTESSGADPAEAGSIPGAGPNAAGTLRRAPHGSQRLRETPADDPYYLKPPEPENQPEGQPGTISKNQMSALHARFAELGIKDRAQRLTVTASIVGRKVPTSSVLSFEEAGRLLTGLAKRAAAPQDAS